MPNLTGQILLGQFRVEEFIAAGSMGEVYRAWDEGNEAWIALKVLPAEWMSDPAALKEVQDNTRPLQQLKHPNIVPFYGLYQASGTWFLLEPYVEGITLRALLKNGALSMREALVYLKNICAALEHAHKNGIVHDNLHSGNVLIDRNGKIWITGFRVAPSAFASVGLAIYRAPEQFQNVPASPLSDMYALGALFFEMLMGFPPFKADDPELADAGEDDESRLEHAHLHRPPPNAHQLSPNIPDFLARLLLRALNKKTTERLSSATEFITGACLAANIPLASLPDHITADDAPLSHAAMLRLPETLTPPDIQKTGTLLITQPTILPERRNNNLALILAVGVISIIAMLLIGIPIYSALQESELMAPTPIPSETPFPTLPPLSLPEGAPTPFSTLAPAGEPQGKIAFTCTRDGFNQICLYDFSSAEITRLTERQAQDYYPIIAPDGEIIYASNQQQFFELYGIQPDGSAPRKITQNLNNAAAPAISPDGTQIVLFNRPADSAANLWLVNRDGSNARILYTGLYNVGGSDWSPDGERIAFMVAINGEAAYEIFMVNADGSGLVQITNQITPNMGGSVDWSPDGRLLAFFAGGPGQNNIYTYDLISSELTQLTTSGGNAGPSFSPDGNWIVFNSNRNGNADLFIMRRDGSDVRQITNDPGDDWQARWGR
jgi:serine/threonine protein kinase